MPTTLESLAQDIKAAPARERWAKRHALVTYMQGKTEASIISEIQRIDDASIANQLIGAGLGARAINALQQRVTELSRA